MSQTPGTRVQAMIDDRMSRGGYATIDDLLVAALTALEQQARAQDFAAGELDQLLAVGDGEIERGEVVDGRHALEDRRRRRAEQAKRAG